MPFLGDTEKGNFFILTSYWNLKKNYYFKILIEAGASVRLLLLAYGPDCVVASIGSEPFHL